MFTFQITEIRGKRTYRRISVVFLLLFILCVYIFKKDPFYLTYLNYVGIMNNNLMTVSTPCIGGEKGVLTSLNEILNNMRIFSLL
jgi:hypothetical protein